MNFSFVDKYLELTTLKEFKKCPKMQCVGSDLLAAVYAEDAHHNFLFFVQPGDDVTASKNAGTSLNIFLCFKNLAFISILNE